VSLEQMLVALYRENQSAFINNNMNLLRAGQILKVPSAEEVQKVAAKDANQEIRTHVADWNSYRGRSPAVPPPFRPRRAQQRRLRPCRIGRGCAARAPAAEPKDQLKISKSEGGKGGAAKGAGGNQERVNALQEEVTAKDKALKESQSRVADLEKQIRDMQRLLDLKAGAPAKPDAKVAAATPPPAPAKPEPAKPAEAPKATVPPPRPPRSSRRRRRPSRRRPSPRSRAAQGRGPKPAEPPKVAEAPKPAPPKADAPKPAAPRRPRRRRTKRASSTS
jgi:pilus assembly protein FimV